jgi:hypothetical protein
MMQNKYTRIYNQIIDRAKTRIIDGYQEKHHIVPESLGGSNDKNNKVHLTAREHFICHWLLTKMTTGDARAKMVYALRMMNVTNDQQQRYTTQITARVYETYRKEHASTHSKIMTGRTASNKGRTMSDEQKKKLSIAQTGKKYSAETIAKRVAKVIGTKRSEQSKLNISLSLKGKPKGPMSEEEKLKRSVKQKGIAKIKTHGSNVAKANIGNISINKDGVEKKVKKDTLQTYLNDGWNLGGKKRKA